MAIKSSASWIKLRSLLGPGRDLLNSLQTLIWSLKIEYKPLAKSRLPCWHVASATSAAARSDFNCWRSARKLGFNSSQRDFTKSWFASILFITSVGKSTNKFDLMNDFTTICWISLNWRLKFSKSLAALSMIPVTVLSNRVAQLPALKPVWVLVILMRTSALSRQLPSGSVLKSSRIGAWSASIVVASDSNLAMDWSDESRTSSKYPHWTWATIPLMSSWIPWIFPCASYAWGKSGFLGSNNAGLTAVAETVCKNKKYINYFVFVVEENKKFTAAIVARRKIDFPNIFFNEKFAWSLNGGLENSFDTFLSFVLAFILTRNRNNDNKNLIR